MAVAGLRGTGDWGTDERPKNFRESILFFNPKGTAPIFGLMAKAGKKTTDDPEFSWWNETQTAVRLQVSGSHAAGDTTITVDSADPTSSTLSANYGTASNLKPGDLLLVEPASDNATFDHELIQVVSVLSDTQFVASRGVGGTSAATIANDLFLLLIGSAFAEGTSAPTAVSRNPVKFNNYTQIFKDTYELTGTANETSARTGSPWTNDKKRKSFDHSRAIEMSILFGRASETTGSNGKPLRYMGGLREFIPSSNTTVFGSAVTMSSLLDALNPIFDFESGAGDTRMAFAGNTAITELAKVLAGTTGVTVNFDKKVSVYGMDFVEFTLPRGTVLFRSHPLLNQNTLYQSSAFVLDFDSIKYVSMKNRDTKYKDDVQADDEDVRRGYVQTECSLMVDRGGLTCAYLGNISST